MKYKVLTYLGISLNLVNADKLPVKIVPVEDNQKKKPVVEMNKRSVEQWKTQLEELAKAPTPTKLQMGAMCYRMSMSYAKFYDCKVCLNKTIFSHDSKRKRARLEVVRSQIAILRSLGLQVNLDETFLCDHCYSQKHGSIDDIEEDNYYWEITNEKKTVRTKYNHFDFYILRAFLKQKDKFKNGFGREFPLKKQIYRLRKLLIPKLTPLEVKEENDKKLKAEAEKLLKEKREMELKQELENKFKSEDKVLKDLEKINLELENLEDVEVNF